MKDPPLSFKLRSIFVIPMVSTFSKILLSLCNIINGHNVECLQEMEKRLKGTSLVTVSNHYSCTDDPALWGSYEPLVRISHHSSSFLINYQEMQGKYINFSTDC
ncbi:tafazzin-like isoform X2 [Scylla paramamosain]|uniref:tafazzin-like isoform X2 n=1 Tax=Scylla paramamosain TaxID=85552 RepID=UPI003082E9AD